jgi:uncharacterized coiled-coil protein SlyX
MGKPISPTKAAEAWGVNRAVLYKKMRLGELSYTSDVSSNGKSRRLIDPAEMLRVFGEPNIETSKNETKSETETLLPDSAIHLDYIEHLKAQLAKKDTLIERQAAQMQSLIEQLNDVNQRLLPAPDDMDDYFEEPEPVKVKRKWWKFGKKAEEA